MTITSTIVLAKDGDGKGDEGGDDDNGDDGEGSNPGSGTAATSGSTTPGEPNDNVTATKKLSKGRVLNEQEVQQVIASGKASSLPLVLAYVANNYPGQVLDVKLRTAGGLFAYEVKVLSKSIFLRTVLLDAKTLKKF